MTEDFPRSERELVQNLNEQGMVKVMEQTKLTLHGRNQSKWRPTVPTEGLIEGLEHLGELTCVATDGLLGWFTNAVGETREYHVQFFKWTNPVISMVPYFDAATRQHKFFKSVKDQGAPGARYRMSPKVREVKERKKSERQRRLDSL